MDFIYVIPSVATFTTHDMGWLVELWLDEALRDSTPLTVVEASIHLESWCELVAVKVAP